VAVYLNLVQPAVAEVVVEHLAVVVAPYTPKLEEREALMGAAAAAAAAPASTSVAKAQAAQSA